MNRNQFELALKHTKSSDWAQFEILCSAFLASEHPKMQTMASPSGDGGRDSQLYNPEHRNFICAQYSVTESWNGKIKNTLTRLAEKFKEVKVLIYMTNHEIGAKGDDLKNELMQSGILLDIRDKNWFLERYLLNETNRLGAENYYDKIGRTYLEGHDVIVTKREALSSQEAKAALVYLGMQWEDATTDKGLTKLSYEALTRCVLRKTNTNNQMSRTEIHAAIHSLLPSHTLTEIAIYTDSAINRLSKNLIKHREKEDTFHISFEEQERLAEKLAQEDLHEIALRQEISDHIADYNAVIPSDVQAVFSRITKTVLDVALLKAGENFSSSVLAGRIQKIDNDLVHGLILEKLSEHGKEIEKWMEHGPAIIKSALEFTTHSPKEVIRRHLKNLSDTYTLFAFLRETPDVQKATKKIFSYGKIWLDTTLILPLLADQLRTDDVDKRFSIIIKNLVASGVKVYVCESAINEILNHIRLALSCANHHQWQGRIPYLFSQFMQDGRSRSQFAEWVSQFRGLERPHLDIQDFLQHEYSIKYDELDDDYAKSDSHLKFAVDRLWREAHEARRSNMKLAGDTDTIDILIRNDVVSYLGIIERRKREASVELGYQHWWLTIDSTAWGIRDSLAKEFESPPHHR